jgi:Zn-dependent protease with chaperone function
VVYANLLIFIAAIFLVNVFSTGSEPGESLARTIVWTALFFALFNYGARRVFGKSWTRSAMGYFKAEQRLCLAALLVFAAILFSTDAAPYVSHYFGGAQLSAVPGIVLLTIFIGLLCIVWLAGRQSYAAVFGATYTPLRFVAVNMARNLPIILPWLILSLLFDLLRVLPLAPVHAVLDSEWGDMLFFGLFLLFIILLFPPIVLRLWGCTPLPVGPIHDHFRGFFRRLGFNATIYNWPLFEGRVLTAAVMGLVPKLRYILLTPAIMQNMNMAELEAVMAHEIGHVKKKHLLLYLVLIIGFALLIGALADPLWHFMLAQDLLFHIMAADLLAPETVMSVVGSLPLFALMLIYFRFIFGYFMRNFERQADLYVIRVLGTGRPLVDAFEKIGGTGENRSKHNWHHFGIDERIAMIDRAERDPSLIGRHDRKVLTSLLIYLISLSLLVGVLWQGVSTASLVRDYEEKFIELVIMEQLEVDDEATYFTIMGDLMQGKGIYDRALESYETALQFAPGNEQALNNLAWLLLTGTDPALRDPPRALRLAKTAARDTRQPHIMDTLATAYWANGEADRAITIMRGLIAADPDNSEFYNRQLSRFQTERYSAETRWED